MECKPLGMGHQLRENQQSGSRKGWNMRAYVCDKCGKVILLEDIPEIWQKGINRITGPGLPDGGLDLCDECVAELVEAVRSVKEGSGGAVFK